MKARKKKTTEEAIGELLKSNTPWSAIKKQLHVGNDRIALISLSMKCNNGNIPNRLPIGRPSKVDTAVLEFIEAKTIEIPTMGSKHLAQHILDSLGIQFSHSTVSMIRNTLKFRFRKPRITQNLTEKQLKTESNFVKKI
jgi:transposase